MKKDIMKYAALFIVIALLVSATLPAMADIGLDINSFWASTTPTINGTMAPGEWADAAVRTFQFEMRDRIAGNLQNTLDAWLYVKNDYTNLYIAVKIRNDTYWATDLSNRWKGFAILFDNNDNGILEQGENGEAKTTWTGSPFYSQNDLYYDAVGGAWLSDVSAGKTNDGAIMLSHTSPVNGQYGNWTFEASIPLIGSDAGFDFNIPQAQLPKEIGYKLWFFDQNKQMDGVYPDEPSTNVNADEVLNAATYGDIFIHPLYYLTVQTTAGGTTNPAPGVYPYGYGTVVSVTALSNVGFMLDHWELDTVNVGSTNPYSVTMNMNHTIKAVFKPIPPVGGFAFSPKQTALPPLVAYYSMIIAIFGVAVSLLRRKRF